MLTSPQSPPRPALPAFLFILAVTAWRLAELAFDAPPISFDEAQYWAWAQTFQLGYYSKPPMVAWAIAATTALLGEGPGAIKLGSTLAHSGTAVVLFFLGRALFDERVGAWSAATWITVPAVSLSSMMISTDPFLLFFWALAMLCLLRAAEGGPRPSRWWAALGLAFGLGLLAKYAMILFALSAALWMAWSPGRRRLARAPGLWLAAAIGLAVYAPNALWNAANGFVSYAHTKDNANLGSGHLFNPDKLAEFLGGQFGVFGPILMATLLVALAAILRRERDDRMRLLAAFALPVLLIMTAQSLLSRANANWTAPAYVASTVLAVAWLAQRAPRLLAASLALHLAGAAVLYNLDTARRLAGLEQTARLDPERRVKGWDVVGARVSELLAAHPGARLLSDERKTLATLIYYVTPHPFDGVKWNPGGLIRDHYDQTTRLEPGPQEYLYVTDLEGFAPHVVRYFAQAELLEEIAVPLYPDYVRRVSVWRVAGFKGYR